MKKKTLNSLELLDYQPNRYPFLMIDSVTDYNPGKFATGFKNLTWNEWYFPVHFEGSPNLPGALQLESMAQMLTVALTTSEGLEGAVTHALEHRVKFKKELIPGMRLDIHTEIESWKRGICKGVGRITVDEELACEARMMITIPEILDSFLPGK